MAKKATKRIVRRKPSVGMTPKAVTEFERAWFNRIWERLGNLQKGIVVLGSIIVASGAFWTYIDGPVPVSNKGLAARLTDTAKELRLEIEKKHTDALTASNSNRETAQKNMDAQTTRIERLVKRVDAQGIENLETQRRTLFTQSMFLQSQKRIVEAAIKANANDELAHQRKSELERWEKIVEDDLRRVDAQIRAAKAPE